MRMSSKMSHIRSGGIFLSSLYVFLLGAASFCMFAHSTPLNEESHHTQHTATHSTLCTWACQVSSSPSNGQVASTPETKPDLLLIALLPNSSSIPLPYEIVSAPSRAPPRVFLSL